MPLITHSLPNLIQGVSQQPDPLRFAGQCTEQVNAYPSLIEGLVKRPNSRHVAQLETPIQNQEVIDYIANVEAAGCEVNTNVSIALDQLLTDIAPFRDKIMHLWVPACNGYLGAHIALIADAGDIEMEVVNGTVAPSNYSLVGGFQFDEGVFFANGVQETDFRLPVTTAGGAITQQNISFTSRILDLPATGSGVRYLHGYKGSQNDYDVTFDAADRDYQVYIGQGNNSGQANTTAENFTFSADMYDWDWGNGRGWRILKDGVVDQIVTPFNDPNVGTTGYSFAYGGRLQGDPVADPLNIIGQCNIRVSAQMITERLSDYDATDTNPATFDYAADLHNALLAFDIAIGRDTGVLLTGASTATKFTNGGKVHFIKTRNDEHYVSILNGGEGNEIYAQDFASASVDGWTANTVGDTLTSIYSAPNETDILQYVIGATGTSRLKRFNTFPKIGDSYLAQAEVFVQIGDSANIGGFRIYDAASGISRTVMITTYDAWFTLEVGGLVADSALEISPVAPDGDTETTAGTFYVKQVSVRDASEKTLKIYNLLDGTPCSIRVDDVVYTDGYLIPYNDYLDFRDEVGDNSPYNNLSMSTIGDTTFVLNKSVPLTIGSERTPTDPLAEASYLFIKQGAYNRKYTVTLRGNFNDGAGGATATFDYTYEVRILVEQGILAYIEYSLTGVTVLNGGTAYEQDALDRRLDEQNFRITSDHKIKTVPKLRFIVDPVTTAIVNVQVLNGGKIIPFTGYVSTRGFGSASILSGESGLPVTVIDAGFPTGELPSGGGAGTQEFQISYISADSTATNKERAADTIYIADRLFESMTNATLTAPLNGEAKEAVPLATSVLNGDFTVTQSGNLIKLVPTGALETYTIDVTDGGGDLSLGLVYKEVGAITDLPTRMEAGKIIKVRGQASLNEDDYWVKFERKDGKTDGIGDGSWVETVAPDILAGLDASKAPKLLTLTAENFFDLKDMPLADRVVGDDETNPHPSFTGLPINDVFYFKDRLGFIIADGVIMTEAGLGAEGDGFVEFNFYRSTVLALLDGDRIDVAVNSNKVINLTHAEPFQDRLLLFSDGQQFSLSGGDILSSSTVSVAPTTNLQISDTVKPRLIGENIYFPFNRGIYSGVTQYEVDPNNEVYVGREITEQVPRYIDGEVRDMEGSDAEEVMAVRIPSRPRELFINKWHISGADKILNSWSIFKHNFEVAGLTFVDSDLYMVGNAPYLTNPNDFDPETVSAYGTGVADVDPQSFFVFVGYEAPHGFQEGDFIQLSNIQFNVPNSVLAGGDTVYANKNPDPDIDGIGVYVYGVVDNGIVVNGGFWTVISIDQVDLVGTGISPENGSAESRKWTYTPHIIKIPMESGLQDPNGFNILLDMRIALTLENGTTTIELPYNKPALGTVRVFKRTGEELPSTTTGNIVTLTTPVAFDSDVYVGIDYPMLYEFSELLFKQPQGQTLTPTNADKLQIRNGSIFHTDTSDFVVEVTPYGRATYSSIFDADTAEGSIQKGDIQLNTGFFRFSVLSSGENTKIVLRANDPLPVTLQSAEFESFTTSRSQRYGR